MTEELVNTYIGRRPASEDPSPDVSPSDPVTQNTTESFTDVTQEAAQSVNEFTEMNPPIYPHAYLPKEEDTGEEESEDAIRGPASFELEQFETVNSTGTLDEIPEDQLNKETQIENENKNNLLQKMINFFIPSAQAQEIATPTPTSQENDYIAQEIESVNTSGEVASYSSEDVISNTDILGYVKPKNGNQKYPRLFPKIGEQDLLSYKKHIDPEFKLTDKYFNHKATHSFSISARHKKTIGNINTMTKTLLLGFEKIYRDITEQTGYLLPNKRISVGRSLDPPIEGVSQSGSHNPERGGAVDLGLTNALLNNVPLFEKMTGKTPVTQMSFNSANTYGGIQKKPVFFFKEAPEKHQLNFFQMASDYLSGHFKSISGRDSGGNIRPIVNEAYFHKSNLNKVVENRVAFLKRKGTIVPQAQINAFKTKVKEYLDANPEIKYMSFPEKLPHYHIQSRNLGEGAFMSKAPIPKASRSIATLKEDELTQWLFKSQNKQFNLLRNTNDQ